MAKKQITSPKQKTKSSNKRALGEQEIPKPEIAEVNHTEEEQSSQQHSIQSEEHFRPFDDNFSFQNDAFNISRFRQLDSSPSRLGQYQLHFDEDVHGIPVIRTRNRVRLPEEEERRFGNFPKFLIGGVKSYRQLFKYDFVQSRNLLSDTRVETVYNLLLNVLRHISSRNPQKYYLMMLFNDCNPNLIEFIRNKTQKTRGEKYYLRIVDLYPPEIIRQAKAILRAVVRRELKDELISEHVRQRNFRGPDREIKMEWFEKYFKNFKAELYDDYVRPIVVKRSVLGQTIFRS